MSFAIWVRGEADQMFKVSVNQTDFVKNIKEKIKKKMKLQGGTIIRMISVEGKFELNDKKTLNQYNVKALDQFFIKIIKLEIVGTKASLSLRNNQPAISTEPLQDCTDKRKRVSTSNADDIMMRKSRDDALKHISDNIAEATVTIAEEQCNREDIPETNLTPSPKKEVKIRPFTAPPQPLSKVWRSSSENNLACIEKGMIF